MENIKMVMLPCIHCDDVKKLIGVPWNETRFGYETEEYDSYTVVETNDEARQSLFEDINWYYKLRDQNPAYYIILALLENELRFVDRMRERGYTDKVLVETHY